MWSPCTDTGFMACFMHPDSRGDAFVMGAMFGTAIGLPLGLVAGLISKHDVWQPVDAHGRPILSIIPGRAGGFDVALSIPTRW